MRFSEREGFQQVPTVLQVSDMDQALRNGLWSVIHGVYFDGKTQYRLEAQQSLSRLGTRLYFAFFKEPLDRLPYSVGELNQFIRDWWMRDAAWWQVYDIVEFITQEHEEASRNASARDICNSVLEQERSAFRFVGSVLTRLTSPEEVAAVERALSDSAPLAGVRHHLLTALELLGNRTNPDYGNSIKESVSAVEGVCRRLSGNPKATLGDGLDALERAGISLHPALVKGFKALYGYTSDADGIRHAAAESPSLRADDATYFLVSCSAFVGYLIAKAALAGLTLTSETD